MHKIGYGKSRNPPDMSAQSLLNPNYDPSLEGTIDLALDGYDRDAGIREPVLRGDGASSRVIQIQGNDQMVVPPAHTQSQSRPGKVSKPKFGAKKKSWVWNWFSQDPTNVNVATCDQCEKVITRLPLDKGSPKKLSEHLRTHKIGPDTPNPRRGNYLSANLAMGNFLMEEGGYSAIRFHKDVMRFLVENKLPLSIVKSPSFRQLVRTLRPGAEYDLNELGGLYLSLVEVMKNESDRYDRGELYGREYGRGEIYEREVREGRY